jgi:hypothetical protein
MTFRKNYSVTIKEAQQSARELMGQRGPTCEGCAALRTYPRPMCSGEASPHFRTARDTYHARCASYSVKGVEAPPVVKKAPPPPPPAKPHRPARLVKLRGVDRVVSEEEYDRLMARSRGRRVGV